MDKATKRNFVQFFAVMALLLACVGVLSMFDTPHTLPLVPNVKFYDPTLVIVHDDELMLVDKEDSRIIHIDRMSLRVKGFENPNKNHANIDHFIDATMNDDSLYIAGYETYTGTRFIKEERVLKYDRADHLLQEVYSVRVPYSLRATRGRILAIKIAKGGKAFVTVRSNDAKRISVLEPENPDRPCILSADFDVPVTAAYYSPEDNTLSVDDSLHRLIKIFPDGTRKNIPDYEYYGHNIESQKRFNKLFRRFYGFTGNMPFSTICGRADWNSKKYPDPHDAYSIRKNDDDLLVMDIKTLDGKKYDRLPFTFKAYLLQQLFWLSLLIVVLAVGCGLWMLFSDGLRKRPEIVLIVVVSALATLGFCAARYSLQMSVAKERVTAIKDVVAYNLTHDYEQMLDTMDEIGGVKEYFGKEKNTADKIRIDAMLEQNCGAGGGRSTSYFASLLYVSPDKRIEQLSATDDTAFMVGVDRLFTEDEQSQILENSQSGNFVSTDTLHGNIITAYGAIRGRDARLRAILKIGFLQKNIFVRAMQDALPLFILLTVILLALYVWRDIFKKERALSNKESFFTMASAFFIFCYAIIANLDLTTFALIICDIFHGVGPKAMIHNFMQPLAYFSAGLIIGKFLCMHPKLGKKLPFIYIVAGAALTTLASFMVAAVAIRTSDYQLYSYSKLLMGFATAPIFYVTIRRRYMLTDEDARNNLIVVDHRAMNAGMTIGILLGGYIARNGGYVSVYTTGAIASLLVFVSTVMLIYLLNLGAEKANLPESPFSKETIKEWLALGGKKRQVVCLLLPAMLLSTFSMGYIPFHFHTVHKTGSLTIALIVFITLVAAHIAIYLLRKTEAHLQQTILLFALLVISVLISFRDSWFNHTMIYALGAGGFFCMFYARAVISRINIDRGLSLHDNRALYELNNFISTLPYFALPLFFHMVTLNHCGLWIGGFVATLTLFFIALRK